MTVGTGHFRLPEEVLNREIDVVRRLGAEFRLKTRVGGKYSLDKLRAEGYEAVLLALGAHRPGKIDLPGHDAEGVIDSLAFLKKVALKEKISALSRVVVLGGGTRSLDAGRTALRLGAKEVTVLFGRSAREMPAEPSEIAEAEKEGIVFRYLSVPTRITESRGKVTGVRFKDAVLSSATSLGRTRLLSVQGPERKLKADLVITSPAYTPDVSGFREAVPRTGWGTIHVDPLTLATTAEGIFAGGDAVTGPKNFIEALAAGRKAALSIHLYLSGEEMSLNREEEGITTDLVSVPIGNVEKKSKSQRARSRP